MVIQHLQFNYSQKDSTLAQSVNRIRKEMQGIEKVCLYHILCSLESNVDHLTILPTRLDEGKFKNNVALNFNPIS